jgi:4-hydroxybenzoate polyprenyltransferase
VAWERGPSVAAVLRILVDVLAYRLRKLEMANLAAAVAIMLVLRLGPAELLQRSGFALLLNLFVYLNNDYHDVRADLAAAGRDAHRTRFLAEHPRHALVAQGALLIGLALCAGPDAGLWLTLLLGGGVCVLYSAQLKRRPYVDVLAMLVWGGAMPLCGVPLDRPLGLALAGQLALFSGVFEALQVRRDRVEDAAAGLRTSAVVLGEARLGVLTRALIVLASLYAALVLHPLAGLAAASALLVSQGSEATRAWTRVKLLFGLSFLISCAVGYLHSESRGLWLSLASESTR